MPSDTNAAVDIFGGWLMSQVDIAGSIAAHRYVGNHVVTVAVNEFLFMNEDTMLTYLRGFIK